MPPGCTLAVAVLLANHDKAAPGLAVLLSAATLLAVAARLSLVLREVHALAGSHELASTDDLTSLPNRRALFAALEQDVAASMTGVLRLDRFGQSNDSLGHHVGDEHLRPLSARLAHQVQSRDLLARLGGDEF